VSNRGFPLGDKKAIGFSAFSSVQYKDDSCVLLAALFCKIFVDKLLFKYIWGIWNNCEQKNGT
jgi:hypothetical protein